MMERPGRGWRLPLSMLGAAALALALPACSGGDDDDDDGTPTPTEAPDTSSPTPTAPTDTSPTPTPTPTPVPEPAGPYWTTGIWYLTYPSYYNLSSIAEFAEYPYVKWRAFARVEDDVIIEATQTFTFYKTQDDLTNNTDQKCIMPETFTAVRDDSLLAKQCKGCEAAYAMVFSPDEAKTTCPTAIVEGWNGATDPYGDWTDTWGLIATPEGYPDDWPSSVTDTYDGYGAAWVVYSPAYGSPTAWGDAYVIEEYCKVFPTDTTYCVE